MKNYFLLFWCDASPGKVPVKSMNEAKRRLRSYGVGSRGWIEKVCGAKHRRHPDEILCQEYRVVEAVTACHICGLIKVRKVYVRADRKYSPEYLERDCSAECACSLCRAYQALPPPSYAFCSKGCGRVSLAGKPCPMCGGPQFKELPTFALWAGFRRNIPELEGREFLEGYAWYRQGPEWWKGLEDHIAAHLDATPEELELVRKYDEQVGDRINLSEDGEA